MRAFILCVGRCGSTTVARALSHATNYTVGHESQAHLVADRLAYPDDHVEVDNRLSWFLGLLGSHYPDAFYVHLTRDAERVAESYAARRVRSASLVEAFGSGILRPAGGFDRMEISRLMVETVNANIAEFLRHREHLTIRLEELPAGFDRTWARLGASGDVEAARRELTVRHNRRK